MSNFELELMTEPIKAKNSSRIILKKGTKNFAVKQELIVVFFVEGKITFAIDNEGTKYLCDKNLTELQALLSSHTFFRANRKYLVNINFIQSFQQYKRVKLLIELALPSIKHQIIISQLTAPVFKRWISES